MSKIKNYYELCKPNVVLMMLLCALVGIILASETMLPIMQIIIPLIGIGLCCSNKPNYRQGSRC
jgi:protoheme IX farnesyltransferase